MQGSTQLHRFYEVMPVLHCVVKYWMKIAHTNTSILNVHGVIHLFGIYFCIPYLVNLSRVS
jgi:hypothetical protein